MRKFLKWTFRIVVLVVLLVVAVIIFRNSIAKFVVEWNLADETGMEVKVGKMDVGIATSVIRIENLKLKNTKEFGGSTFLDIPEIYVEYDRDALVSGKFHATLMRFTMTEVSIVRNQAGKTNIYTLTERIEKKHRHKKRKEPDFGGVDELKLTLGRARYLDLKTPANNYEFNFYLQNETVKNVKSERDLTGVIMLAVIRNTAVMAGTENYSVKSLLRDPQGTIDKTKQFLDLLIPPKKARKTNQIAAPQPQPTIRKK